MSEKPLGRKSYGSIAHLPNSRMGPGDHHCHPGQAVIATLKARDKHDRIIATEKLDGSNVGVARIGDEIVALGRSGYRASTSKYEQHQLFAHWVREHEGRFREALADGERFCGEWLAQAHGTRYALPHEPFVVFDMMVGERRKPWDEVLGSASRAALITARVLSDGAPYSVEAALRDIETSGHGAIDPVEGAVWRVERHGEFDFMAKYVRPEKADGAYLPEIGGGDPIWHWRPSP